MCVCVCLTRKIIIQFKPRQTWRARAYIGYNYNIITTLVYINIQLYLVHRARNAGIV